ncbi:sugar transferase [Mycolicibacterium sp.]|uniref:sugar transferase n=1 Tax=Mycolicibacterium sp. TaxID=2320850 RepID=UPI003D143476
MTEVIEPSAAHSPWGAVGVGSDVLGGSAGDAAVALNRHRGDAVAGHAGAGEVNRTPSLRVVGDVVRAPDEQQRTGVRLLGRVRAWMVVPVVDFVLMLLPLAWRPPQPTSVLTMAILATLLLSGGGRYVARLHLSVLDELPAILTRLLTAVAAVSTIILYLHQKAAVLVFLETACQAVALVIVGRVVMTRILAIGRKRGIAQHHTVLIGGGPVATELARILAEHKEYGITLDGFVDDGDSFPADAHLPRLGRLADLDMAVASTGAETLLVADGNFEERAVMDAVRTTACRHTELLVVPRMHYFHTLTGMADHIGSIPIMRIRNPNLRGPARLIKRLFDIVVAATALIILSPVLALAALAVRIEGGPGVIFRQVRVGRDGKHFELLKFRSMRPANDLESQTQWSVATDNRVGPVGRFLRCTSIDELPQLWNILRGDMTVVGPRPERPHFVEQFSTQFDRYAHRHRVQVGLTGFAQVSGLRGDTSIADRARYDNFYIENWSLWLDIKIIFRTFREVLFYRER